MAEIKNLKITPISTLFGLELREFWEERGEIVYDDDYSVRAVVTFENQTDELVLFALVNEPLAKDAACLEAHLLNEAQKIANEDRG